MNLDTAIPIGRGATGEVLRAFDRERGEEIALKVLLTDDPALVARLEREAKAQQSLSHPHICPVYGVSDLDGRRCIAMRFIDGQPLDAAAADLSLRQKVELLRTVVAAIEYAHDQSVIHRDLKPANILVQETADGLHPWIVDFGLARAVDDQTLTLHGQALGTPGYMAPEQARGEKRLDGRCDVYALGVLLHQLLAGRLPHQAESVAEMMLKTVADDAPSIRSLDSQLPDPLVRIVDQCLERSPALRYQSASELLADLDAYLAGTPVSARSRGRLHQVRRWIRRRPGISAVLVLLSVSVLIAAILAGMGFGSRTRYAEEQAELARHYSDVAADLESRLRLIYARPAHDVRDEVVRIQAQLGDLETRAPAEGPAAEAAIRFVLGRAWFALGRLDVARRNLDAAWHRGMRGGQVSLYLGRTYVGQYDQALAQVRLEPDPEQRAARERVLRRELLTPGLEFLQEGLEAISGDGDFANNVQGVLAQAQLMYYQDQAGPALDLLASQAEQSDWPAPLWLLSGSLRYQQALALSVEDNAQAMELNLLAANQDLERAIELLRSNPTAHRLRCRATAARIGLRIEGLPQQDDDQYNLEVCQTLLALDPSDPQNTLAAAAAMERQAALQYMRNDDATQAWRRAEQLADQTLVLQEGNPEAWYRRGLARLTGARQMLDGGEDPGNLVSSAISDLERAIEIEPSIPNWYLGLASALSWSAREAYTRGESGDVQYQRAVNVLAEAAQLPGVGAATRIRLPYTLTWQGYYRYSTGQLADELLQQSVEEARAVVAEFPEVVSTHIVHGYATWTMADYLLIQQRDPEPFASEAVAAYERALAMDSSRFSTRYNAFSTRLVRIQGAQLKGDSAAQDIAATESILASMQEEYPDDPGMMLQRAALARLRGIELANSGGEPLTQFALSRSELDKAAETELDSLEVLNNRACLAVAEHQWRAANARFDVPLFAADMQALGEGLEQLPDLRMVYGERGRLAMIGVASGLLGNDEEQRLRAQARDDVAAATQDNELLQHRFDDLRAELQP